MDILWIVIGSFIHLFGIVIQLGPTDYHVGWLVVDQVKRRGCLKIVRWHLHKLGDVLLRSVGLGIEETDADVAT